MTGRRADAWRPLRSRSSAILAAMAAVAVVVAAAGAAGAWVLGQLEVPWRGWNSPSVRLDVPPGSSGVAVFRALEEGGVLRERHLGTLAQRLFFRGKTLKAGEYRFSAPASPREVVSRLVAGDVVAYRVTVPEGLEADEAFGIFVAAGFGTREAFAALARSAAADPTPFHDLPAGARSLTGFLFPETYTFTRRTTPREIVEAMLRQFRRSLPERFEERAREGGMTLVEAVTLASIVEKETALPAERPLVAGVYRNRLAKGMLLQADPTSAFAARRLGLFGGTLTHADLERDDPWNTYRSPGLPPGPICSPGRASLEAAVSPARTLALFFVATGAGDGGHRFSTDWAGHERNVASYRRAQRAARRP